MKQKEIKNLAKKIAQFELKLQQPDLSTEEKTKAENEIIKLSSHIGGIDDMIALDDAIQEILLTL